MKGKMKRILAFLCAVVLVATTFLGSWYTKQAKAANIIEPVSLDGYENITIKDFEGLEPGTLTAGGGYKLYPAKNITGYDGMLLSMKVTFGGGSYTTRLDVAGKGWWSGLQIYPNNAAGDQLWVVSAGPDQNQNYGMTDSLQSFAITPAEADVDKFVNEELLLQLAFDFGEVNNDYINEFSYEYIVGLLNSSIYDRYFKIYI